MTYVRARLSQTGVRTKAAISKAAGRLEDPYVSVIRENFVSSVSEIQIENILDQIGGGDGSELKSTNGRIKFGAAHSSSALVANTFGPWIDRPEKLVVAGSGNFVEMKLEQKFPTGLGGNAPNLDVWLDSKVTPVAIESKFTEYLKPKSAEFRPSYENLVNRIADQSWAEIYRDLKADPLKYDRPVEARGIRFHRNREGLPCRGEDLWKLPRRQSRSRTSSRRPFYPFVGDLPRPTRRYGQQGRRRGSDRSLPRPEGGEPDGQDVLSRPWQPTGPPPAQPE